MGAVRSAGRLFSPLDAELGLLSGRLTPLLQEQAIRLGTWIPSFEKAAALFQVFTGTPVSEPTVRRRTEAAGAAQVAVQAMELAALPAAGADAGPAAPARVVVSVDGAMVPVLHGEWREVRTAAIGLPEPARRLPKAREEQEVTLRELSYFSRMTEAATFTREATAELRRRGVDRAGAVRLLSDGADWCQSFMDYHRPEAERILDFGHAGERVGKVGRGLFGSETGSAQAWTTGLLHRLKHEGPEPVFTALAVWEQTVASEKERTEIGKHLAYLEKRAEQLAYPTFRAEGWPIGSGCVESANKLVVEDRLKGSGMHWAPEHVDPMLALRNVVCNDRWDEAWGAIAGRLRGAPTARSGEAAPLGPAAGLVRKQAPDRAGTGRIAHGARN